MNPMRNSFWLSGDRETKTGSIRHLAGEVYDINPMCNCQPPKYLPTRCSNFCSNIVWQTGLAIIVFVVFATEGYNRPLNVNTRGFSMGQLSKVRLKGKTNRIVRGELLLGKNSHAYIETKEREVRHHRRDIDNPWLFCAERDVYYDIENLVGEYVVVEFKTPKKSALIQCKGENELIRIYPVNRYGSDLGAFESRTVSLSTHSSGVHVGRLVNASEGGKHSLNWEIVLQDGNSGSHFKAMSIADRDLYNFAIESLKHANQVKVYYVERFVGNIKRGDTGLYVWKIKNLDGI